MSLFFKKILDYIRTGFVSGLLGGALAGFAEAISKGIIVDYSLIKLTAIALIYYGLGGVTFGIAFALIAYSITLPTRGLLAGNRLTYIIFGATVAVLGAPYYFRILFKEFSGVSYDSFTGFALESIVIYLMFVVSVFLFWLFQRICGLLKARWQLVGIILYIAVLITLSPFAFTGQVDEHELIPYDEGRAPEMGNKPNIFFIVIDALRYDCLSTYDDIVNTPVVEKLAKDGILYTNAFVQCSWTKPSVASMMTSLYPGQHSVETSFNIINPRLTTVAKVLNDNGYYTIGFHNNDLLTKLGNFHIGFNYYQHLKPDTPYPAWKDMPYLSIFDFITSLSRRLMDRKNIRSLYYRSAEITTETVIEWLKENHDKRLFMFLHYMDPHEPYFLHPYTGEYRKPPEGFSVQDSIECFNAYKDEVGYIDAKLRPLYEYLKTEGLYDEALIILTSDHGEEFYDHQGWAHGKTLYDELIHVPLIIKPPALTRFGDVDSSLVQSIDIPPTIAAYAGCSKPVNWEGRDIFSPDSNEWAYAQLVRYGKRSTVIRDTRYKLYVRYNLSDGIEDIEFYDTQTDPQERKDLSEIPEYSSTMDKMLARVGEFENHISRSAVETGTIKIDEETARRLKALGYLE
ncbi:MAG: sulfatase-like hydrolase/transferase [candidate division Zixibacteria bacterium]|nr:sulfatase-like hydrolase/transferase [candidate division Zixibacteria bacterium]